MTVTIDGIDFNLQDFVGDDGLGHTRVQNPATGSSGAQYPQEPLFPERIFGAMLTEVSQATTAAAQAVAAKDAALAASVSSPNSTSATSNIIASSGIIQFVLNDDIPTAPFQIGQYIKAVSQSNVQNSLFCLVTDIDESTETLTCDIEAASGSGTHNDWRIITTGPRGEDAQIDFGTVSNEAIDAGDTMLFGDADALEGPRKTTFADIITYQQIMMRL